MYPALAKLLDGLRALLSARGGNVAVTFGLALIPVVGTVGAAVDYARANSAQARMQAAADAAALRAAIGSYSADSDRVTAGVNAFNADYHSQLGAASPTVTVANNAVTVTASGSVPTTVLGVMGFNSMAISTTATARIGGGQTACILALQTSNDAIFVHGSAGLRGNCGFYSNSTSSNGIDFDGDSVTSARSMCVAGNYYKDSQAQVSPLPQTRCPAVADPLASLPAPSNAAAACNFNGYKLDGTGTLNPGVYCGGIEISSSGRATFNPGIYIIRDGQFNIGSSAQVTGQNVMFYLTGSNANLNQGSSSHMNVTAPNSGTYKGIVFFQSRTANTSANQFGGSTTDVIQCAVYFPNGTAEINCNGTVGASADYTIWVVKRLQLDSSATLQVTSNYAGSSTPVADALSPMVNGTMAMLMR